MASRMWADFVFLFEGKKEPLVEYMLKILVKEAGEEKDEVPSPGIYEESVSLDILVNSVL